MQPNCFALGITVRGLRPLVGLARCARGGLTSGLSRHSRRRFAPLGRLNWASFMAPYIKYKWRIYADNDIEREIVDHLRGSNMDVLWISEDPKLRRQEEDRFHYQKARQLGRYLLTRDQGFWDDRKHPLAVSPGVLIISSAEMGVAKFLPVVLQKLMDANNPLGEPVTLEGIKVRMGSESFSIKYIDQETQRVTTDTFKWEDLV